MTTTTRYNDHEYVKRAKALRDYVASTGAVCHLCGAPFDLTLHYTHPMSFTADHLDAIATGGSLHGNLAPAHRRCNSKRGKKRLATAVPPPKNSVAW